MFDGTVYCAIKHGVVTPILTTPSH